jgi:hypothetical protein
MKHNAPRSFGLLLLLAPLSYPRGTGAAPVSAVQIETTTHGVKLFLSIPRRTYPRNALVRVTVRLQNISRRTVLVSGNNPSTVVVLDASHRAVYWPDTPFLGQALFGESVPPRLPLKLRPQQRPVNSFFLILRGPLLQAEATLDARA